MIVGCVSRCCTPANLCAYLNKEIEVLNHRTWRYSIFTQSRWDWGIGVPNSFGNCPKMADYHDIWFPQSKWLVLTRDCGRGTKMKRSQASLDLHIPSQLAATARGSSPRKFVGWQSASSLKKGWRQCVEFVSCYRKICWWCNLVLWRSVSCLFRTTLLQTKSSSFHRHEVSIGFISG